MARVFSISRSSKFCGVEESFCSNGNLFLLIARHCKKNSVDNAAGLRIEQLDTFFLSGNKIEMPDERSITPPGNKILLTGGDIPADWIGP